MWANEAEPSKPVSPNLVRQFLLTPQVAVPENKHQVFSPQVSFPPKSSPLLHFPNG